MKKVTAALAVAVLLGGCAPHIVPQPLPGAVVNDADRSLTLQARDLTVSARVQDLDVAPYRLDGSISSFYISVINGSSVHLSVPLDRWILLDGAGTQYNPLSPSTIRQIAEDAAPHLIPYPYVGFYYMEDYEKYGFFNTFTSALPYYAESGTPDPVTRALDVDNLLPGARTGGEIYFAVDLATRETFELRLYLPSTPLSGPADFTFPFRVEK